MAVWFSASACVSAVMACWLWRRLARPADNVPSAMRYAAALLAIVAIACQGLALRSLWGGGVLWPIPSAEADLNYYQRLDRQLASLQSSTQLSSDQFELAKKLREQSLEWTARELIDTADASTQRAAFLALAAEIRPLTGSHKVVADYLAVEESDIKARLAAALTERQHLIERQSALSAEFRRLSELSKQLAAEEEPVPDNEELDNEELDDEALDAAEQAEQAADEAAGQRQAELRGVAAQLTEAETLALRLRREIQRLQGRQAWRADRMQEPGGLSSHGARLQLPVVVAGGWRWWLGLWLAALLATGGLLKLLLSHANERRQPTMLIVVGLCLLQWWLTLQV